jgi:hypothetical protein
MMRLLRCKLVTIRSVMLACWSTVCAENPESGKQVVTIRGHLTRFISIWPRALDKITARSFCTRAQRLRHYFPEEVDVGL